MGSSERYRVTAFGDGDGDGQDGGETWADTRPPHRKRGTLASVASGQHAFSRSPRLSHGHRSSNRSLQDMSTLGQWADAEQAHMRPPPSGSIGYSERSTPRFFAKSQTEPHIPTAQLKALLKAELAANASPQPLPLPPPMMQKRSHRESVTSSNYETEDRGPRVPLEDTQRSTGDENAGGLPPPAAPTASLSPCLRPSLPSVPFHATTSDGTHTSLNTSVRSRPSGAWEDVSPVGAFESAEALPSPTSRTAPCPLPPSIRTEGPRHSGNHRPSVTVTSPRGSAPPSPLRNRSPPPTASLPHAVRSPEEQRVENPPKASPNAAPVEMKWKRGQMLGQGAFGKVWVGLNLDSGTLMAVKQIVFSPQVRDLAVQLKKLQYEIKVMKQLSHPNIVRYMCTERCGNCVNIFMEYVAGGSISAVLKEFGPLDEPAIKSYSTQIAHALHHLHTNRIIHRDVKGGNVLLEVEGNCKVCDFGTAAYIHELTGGRSDQGMPQGTPNWMAPEVISEEPYDEKCDIWSFGCMILEMLTGGAPFSWISQQPAAVMLYIARAKKNGDEQVEIPKPVLEGVSQRCLNLMHWCLAPSPNDRPTAAQVLEHSFLQEEEYSSDEWTSDGVSTDQGQQGPSYWEGMPSSPCGAMSVNSMAGRSIGHVSDANTEIISLDNKGDGLGQRQPSMGFSPGRARGSMPRSTSIAASLGASLGALPAGGPKGLDDSGDLGMFHRASLVLQSAHRHGFGHSATTLPEQLSPQTSLSRRKMSWAGSTGSRKRGYADTETSSMQRVTSYLRSKVMEDLITDHSSLAPVSEGDDTWRAPTIQQLGTSHSIHASTLHLSQPQTHISPGTAELYDLRDLIAMKIDTTQHTTTPSNIDQIPDEPLEQRVRVPWDDWEAAKDAPRSTSPEHIKDAPSSEGMCNTSKRWALVVLLLLIIVVITIFLVTG
eukprot:TRINITY_DN8659_c0_g1_i1.p1 TRINITY_DN8659_c0_g1~~TRINITY_DN8659_c0_g1_i1.p1  ORF type:complete len:935 (+),score=201.39 TRINITY_DN8659_c0_g1_i1:139-2943(+)